MMRSVVKLWSCRHDIPPGRLRGRVALDDQQLIELLIDVGRVNAQTGEDGILQQTLQRDCPRRAGTRASDVSNNRRRSKFSMRICAVNP